MEHFVPVLQRGPEHHFQRRIVQAFTKVWGSTRCRRFVPGEGTTGPRWKAGNSIGPRPFGVDAQAAASRLGSLQSAVLPLPGRAVTYPDHMRDAYEIASQEMSGLPLKVFHDDDSFIPLEGAYRHLAVVPQNVEWQFLSVDEVSHMRNRLVLSDVDQIYARVKDLPALPVTPRGDGQDECAVLLSCTLPPSAYVKMALRELTRGRARVRDASAGKVVPPIVVSVDGQEPSRNVLAPPAALGS